MCAAAVLWFTGLSGAGKTTVALAAKEKLEEEGYRVLVLDGDVVRATFNCHLGFTDVDIKMNNELIVDMCLSNRNNIDIIFVPIISPYQESRQGAKVRLGKEFYEIYFNASLSVVSKRDIKGLYAKAQAGELRNMIGVASSNPYEAPANPDLRIDSGSEPVEVSVRRLLDFIRERIGGPVR